MTWIVNVAVEPGTISNKPFIVLTLPFMDKDWLDRKKFSVCGNKSDEL
jgi:hypothetical protein